MIGIESVTQSRDTSRNLVELNPLLAAIYVGEISRPIKAEARDLNAL